MQEWENESRREGTKDEGGVKIGIEEKREEERLREYIQLHSNKK